MIKKLVILILIASCLGFLAANAGLSSRQALAISIFSMSILGSLFFWDFRLSFVFLGTSILLATGTIDLEHLVRFASLEVILFLVGMMILVALLKDEGFFVWLTRALLQIKNITAAKFVIILAVVSAISSAMVDEVTSIIFMVAAILEICKDFEVDPSPFVIISVLATNIGSAATVLGNPIGILIAVKSGLTFEDFLTRALPLAAACLLVTICVVLFWYRRSIKRLDGHLKNSGKALAGSPLPPMTRNLKISLAIFFTTLVFISLHRRLESLWGLSTNTLLLVMPLVASAFVIIWKRSKGRHYVEKDVEWWTLLFFLLLFAQAGALKFTGVADVLANNLVRMTTNNVTVLTGAVLWIATIGSSMLDNVVLVSTLIPVIQGFKGLGISTGPLWWALLFGGCLGGNITLIGSTANIVAIGIMEKEKNIKMTFLRWFGIGLTVGIITASIAWLALVTLPIYR